MTEVSVHPPRQLSHNLLAAERRLVDNDDVVTTTMRCLDDKTGWHVVKGNIVSLLSVPQDRDKRGSCAPVFDIITNQPLIAEEGPERVPIKEHSRRDFFFKASRMSVMRPVTMPHPEVNGGKEAHD